MSSKRRTYTREFKIEAVKLSHNSDKTVEEVAQGLGMSKSNLSGSKFTPSIAPSFRPR